MQIRPSSEPAQGGSSAAPVAVEAPACGTQLAASTGGMMRAQEERVGIAPCQVGRVQVPVLVDCPVCRMRRSMYKQ